MTLDFLELPNLLQYYYFSFRPFINFDFDLDLCFWFPVLF